MYLWICVLCARVCVSRYCANEARVCNASAQSRTYIILKHADHNNIQNSSNGIGGCLDYFLRMWMPGTISSFQTTIFLSRAFLEHPWWVSVLQMPIQLAFRISTSQGNITANTNANVNININYESTPTPIPIPIMTVIQTDRSVDTARQNDM